MDGRTQRLGINRLLKTCRLGYIIGPTSPNLRELCHSVHWASKFTRKLARSSLGGEVYAFGEMLDHMAMLRGFVRGYGGSGGLRKPVYASRNELSGRGEISGAPFFGHSAGDRTSRTGHCVLDPGAGESGGWSDQTSQFNGIGIGIV